ncbi:extracellular solute-binding protein [Pseudomonas sp. Fl4BN2]|nr:extracellular solute-binding protein [Pseudomonas sp. Fl4BN2]
MKSQRSVNWALATLLSVGLAQVQAADSQVHIYNWYDFIAPDATKNFQAETGISSVYDVYDSSDVMQSKLMVGGSGYDVVVASNDVLPNLIKAGVLKELDRSQLPNLPHLDPAILAKMQNNDPGNRYAVPYLWGTTGIGYDADKVRATLGPDAAVDSWDLIFKEENISKLSQCGVAMLDAPGDIISIALHYLGLPQNSSNPLDYQKAEALLLKVRPYIRYFDSSRFITDLANGNVCVVVGWAGGVQDAKTASLAAGNGRTIGYSIPREGAPIWIENLVLLNDAPNPQQGLAFINYMLRPEVIARTSNHLKYPNGNQDARELVDKVIRDDTDIYPTEAVMATLFPLQPMALKLERIRTRLWSKVKSGT